MLAHKPNCLAYQCSYEQPYCTAIVVTYWTAHNLTYCAANVFAYGTADSAAHECAHEQPDSRRADVYTDQGGRIDVSFQRQRAILRR